MKPEDLLRKWTAQVPRDGAKCEEAVAVMKYLGMEVTQRSTGHWTGKHSALVGSVYFPQGVITVNCHAVGVQGRAHPSALRDIVRAARIIREEIGND